MFEVRGNLGYDTIRPVDYIMSSYVQMHSSASLFDRHMCWALYSIENVVVPRYLEPRRDVKVLLHVCSQDLIDAHCARMDQYF